MSDEPPPMSMVIPSDTGSRLLTAIAPYSASSFPSITLIESPSSFCIHPVNSLPLGASRSADVATQSVLWAWYLFIVWRKDLRVRKARRIPIG